MGVAPNSDKCLALGSDAHSVASRGDIGDERGLWAANERNDPDSCPVDAEFTMRYLDLTTGVERDMTRAGGRTEAA